MRKRLRLGMRGFRAFVVVAAAASASLAACGTRVSHADVIAGAGGGPVTISSHDTPVAEAPVPTSSSSVEGVVPTHALSTLSSTGSGAGGGEALGSGGASQPAIAGTSTKAGTPIPTKTPAASASAATSASATPGQTCTKPGSTIVFGQVGTFSGIIGASQGSAQPGLKVWAAATNAAGGIACHPVQVVSIDDGGDAARAQSAVQTLVESDHAVAINAFVPVTMNGIQPYVDAHHIPVVGGDLLSTAWNTDPTLFPQGTYVESSVWASFKFASSLGKSKLAFLYCIEASPCTYGQSLIKAGLAEKAGLQLVYDAPISLAGSNFTQQCSSAKSAGADILFIGAGATAATAIGRDCSNQGFHPLYTTLSLGALSSLEGDANLQGLEIASPVFAWPADTTPAEQAYQAALQKYAPGLDNGGGAASAWASGKLLEKAILNLGGAAFGDLTPDLVTKGLQSIRKETLAGLVPGSLSFSAAGPATQDRCAYVAQIVNSHWAAPVGDKQFCEP